MKILFTMNLPYFPAFGGAAKNNRYLLEHLVRKGHSARVIVPIVGTSDQMSYADIYKLMVDNGLKITSSLDADVFHLNGVDVHAVHHPTRLRGYLIEQIHAFKPERVIVECQEATYKILEAAIETHPYVVCIAQTPSLLPFGPNAFYSSQRKTTLLRKAAAIVTTSKFLANYVRQWSDLEPVPIHMPVYGDGPFPDLGSFANSFVTMINPCQIKGIAIFLELACALPQIQFAAVPTWGTTREDLKDLQSLPNIHILSAKPDFDEILAQTCILLVPSLWQENFPLTIMEAMLRGIPVLASDVGGIPEVKLGTDFVFPVKAIEKFTDDYDAHQIAIPIIPKQDIKPWQEALLSLLSSQAFYDEQGKTMRQAALKFVSHLTIEPFETLLLQLTHEPKQQPSLSQSSTCKAVTDDISRYSKQIRALTPEQRALLILQLRKRTIPTETENTSMPQFTA